MSGLRVAVIGVGYLGRFHAQKYAAHPDCELVAAVDPDPVRRETVAAELDCRALADTDALAEQIDAASIVSPTRLHHDLAMPLLRAGLHLLPD